MGVSKRDLVECVEEINSTFEELGASVRFVIQGRNGYQAVDEYQVGEDGERLTSCNRNVVCGSSRECVSKCWTASSHIVTDLRCKALRELIRVSTSCLEVLTEVAWQGSLGEELSVAIKTAEVFK